MPATDRYALIVESQSRGDQELVRFENALNRAGDSAERQGQRFRQFSQNAQIAGRAVDDYAKSIAKSVAEMYLLEKAGEKVVSFAVQGARAYAEHRGATERLVDGYRALRIGIASTEGAMAALTAAGTVGLGILIERTLQFANAQAKVYEANAFAAARSPNRSFQSIQAGQYLDRISGQAVSQYFPDPNAGVNTIRQFEALRDPLERIKFAVDNFGDDAEKVFPLLNRRIRENIDSAQDLSRTIDTDTRRSIAAFRQDIGAFSQVFDGVGDSYRRLKEQLKQEITIKVSAAFDFTRTLARRLPELPGEEAGTTTDRPRNAGDIIFTPEDLLREAGVDLRRPRAPGRPPADPRLVSRASSAMAARLNTESGVRDALSDERRRLSTLEDYFTLNPDKRGDVALPLLQAAETVKRLEEKLKSFDTSAAEKAARQAARVVEIIAGIGERNPVEQAQYARLRGLQDLVESGANPAQLTQANALFTGNIARVLLEQQAPSAARIRQQNVIRFLPENLQPIAGFPNAVREFVANSGELQAFGAPMRAAQASQDRAILEGSNAANERSVQRRIEATQRLTDYEARRLQILAGPGGEVFALERSVSLRMQAVDLAAQLGAQIDVQAEKTRILQERDLALLEIQQRRVQQFRSAVEQSFDALVTRGGGGVADVLRSQFLGFGRTVTGNLATQLYSGASGRLTIPGQTRSVVDPQTGNTVSEPTLLGKILANTPFAADPLKTATDRNTEATNLNTAALMGRAGAGASLGSVSGGALSTIPSALGLPSYFPKIGGATRSNVLPGYTGTAADSAVNRAVNEQLGIKTPISSDSSSALKGIGVAGILASSAFGAYSGFKAGGAQGVLQGSSSILGGAGAMLAMLAPATGPLAPILLGASLATGLGAALLGDPKKRRDRALNNLIDSAHYVSNTPMAYDMDLYGRGVDYGANGGPRIIVQQTIQTMDSKSFIDHADDIASATQFAIQNQHGLNQTMRETVLGGM